MTFNEFMTKFKNEYLDWNDLLYIYKYVYINIIILVPYNNYEQHLFKTDAVFLISKLHQYSWIYFNNLLNFSIN
jgi:hypothetical protein